MLSKIVQLWSKHHWHSPCLHRADLRFSVPPVLCDPALAKATYDDLEKRVEAGVKRIESKDRTKSEGK